MAQITKDTIIGDILDMDKTTAPFFLEMGMHCLGCPASRGESLEQACICLLYTSGLTHDLNYTNAHAFGSELLYWNSAGGKFYSGLFYRRLVEANVYNYGDYNIIRYNKYNYTYPSTCLLYTS